MRISDWSSDVCSSDLQLLAGIILGAEAGEQLAVEPRRVAGRVGQFVKAGPVIIDLFEKDWLRRHLHEVLARDIENPFAADAKIDAARRDYVFGDGHDLAFGERFGVGREAGAKPFALRDVEHGKAFEEGNRLGVAAGFGSAGLFGLGDEAVGIDDGGSTLALPDRSARVERLAEGQPALRGEAVVDHRTPQDQDIDARIAPRGERVARQTGAGAAGSAPRSEEHTSELQSLMRIAYAVFCLKKKKTSQIKQ